MVVLRGSWAGTVTIRGGQPTGTSCTGAGTADPGEKNPCGGDDLPLGNLNMSVIMIQIMLNHLIYPHIICHEMIHTQIYPLASRTWIMVNHHLPDTVLPLQVDHGSVSNSHSEPAAASTRFWTFRAESLQPEPKGAVAVVMVPVVAN